MGDFSNHVGHGTLARLVRAAQLFRPRTLVRLGRTDERLQQQIDALSQEVRTLKSALGVVVRRERQLRDILETEFGSSNQLAQFEAMVRDRPIAPHIETAIVNSPIELSPLAHCVIDDLLPPEYYNALVAAVPPRDLFRDRPDHDPYLAVPPDLGPRYVKEVWRHMAEVVVDGTIRPALLSKFRDSLSRWVHQTGGDQPLDGGRLTPSGGRLARRRPGCRILPARDPTREFLTCLIYIGREEDDGRWGTQLFAETEDGKRSSVPVTSDGGYRLVGEVAFRPNRALVILNALGAHGVDIPADAKPASLEHYVYEFTIGAASPSGPVPPLPR